MTSTPTPPGKPARRRASRPAGPTNDKAPEATAVRVPAADSAGATAARKMAAAASPQRRLAPSRLVMIVALACGLVATTVVGAAVAVLIVQKNHAEAAQARNPVSYTHLTLPTTPYV